MCFSATASFAAGAVLTAAGVVAIKKVHKPSQLLFAGIPLLFAVQQFTEGFVWLSLTSADPPGWQKIPVLVFLLLAVVVWPAMVPLSIMLLEKNATRKKILSVLFGISVLLSCFMLYTLIFRNVSANIMSFHIHYEVEYPFELPYLKGIPYFIAVVLPQFISSIKRMKLFGVAIILSFIVTNIYFEENVVSVWCFFAAIISIIVISVIWKQTNEA